MRIERSAGEVTHPLIDKDADRRKGEKKPASGASGETSGGEKRREEVLRKRDRI